jgi:hypothetical protein
MPGSQSQLIRLLSPQFARQYFLPRTLTIPVACAAFSSADFFHAIRPNGILTNSLQSTTPANSPLPAESGCQNNRNLSHLIVFNDFILVRFLGGYKKMAKIQGLRHPFRIFIHKVIHSFCA